MTRTGDTDKRRALKSYIETESPPPPQAAANALQLLLTDVGFAVRLRVFAMMISRAAPEGVVNAPSKESGWPTTGQATTDAAIARLTETLRALSKEAGENADAFLAKVTMVADP